MQVKIDKGVPEPTTKYKGWTAVAEKMAIGDSVGGLLLGQSNALRTALSRLGYKSIQQKQEDGTIRVWKREKVEQNG